MQFFDVVHPLKERPSSHREGRRNKEPPVTNKTKTVVLRFVRSLAALVIAGVATWVVSPDVLGIVPDDYEWVVFLVLAPGLQALNKWLRYGDAPGEE
jgi:hypothetical protein